jgi:hypothetical protein
MPKMYLAQLNVARMLGPIDGQIMRPFVELLAPVNAIAEASKGFVWRDQTPAGDNTAVRIDDDPMLIVNFSVWESPADLEAFVYQGLHKSTLSRRKEWFELPKISHYVLWWIEEGSIPTRAEAVERLEYLRKNGESDYAFTFRFLKRS